MNKSEAISIVAEDTGNTKQVVEAIYNSLLAAVTAALEAGEEVSLPGIGKLKVVDKDARTGRNPATGEAVDVPAHKAIKFSASSTLKDAINA